MATVDWDDPQTWGYDDYVITAFTAIPLSVALGAPALSEFGDLSAGNKIDLGLGALQLALVWHFVHYPATFQVPAEVGITLAMAVADATLALYTTVPPWTVTTGLGLAGVVPLAGGLWPVLRGGEGA